MKKLTNYILVLSLISNLAFADCNPATDIKPLPDGTYSYTLSCHLMVGSMKKQIASQTQQLTELQKAITLKDLAFGDSQKDVQIWQSTSLNLQDRLTKVQSIQKENDFLYFALGIAATIGTGFMAAKIIGK